MRAGGLLYVSGQGPLDDDGRPVYVGRAGADLTAEEVYLAARLTGINTLRVIEQELGSLDLVDHLIKALALVNCGPDFYEQPAAVHGFSDLMIEAFGPERGSHARTAMGTSTLPRNIPVEVELTLAIRAAATTCRLSREEGHACT